jgi:hypothetical protein
MLSTCFPSHGDTKHIVLLPSTVEECSRFAQEAFNIAERYQTAVFCLGDLDFGMNNWVSELAALSSDMLRPSRIALDEIMKSLMKRSQLRRGNMSPSLRNPAPRRRVRKFLPAVFFAACALLLPARTAEDNLHILPVDSIERLRLDFNASRSKVRLVFMLSPT